MADVIVIGSLNMDLTMYVDHFPQTGETLTSKAMMTSAGGKGSNQALAAARLGARVAMAGCVGKDAYGDALIEALKAENIDTTLVRRSESVGTGTAMIAVCGGSNKIIVDAGANACVTPRDIEAMEDDIAKARALILQFEIPLQSVERAIEIASCHATRVFLNPAPYQDFPMEVMAKADYVIPNETEAMRLLGWERLDAGNAEKALRLLRAAGIQNPIITMGSRGVAYLEGETCHCQPCCPVQAVDSTAAGDTFIGALSSALLCGKTLSEAVAFAQRAAAYCVSRKGAHASIPTLRDLM